jgi:hypothetical protein
LGSGWCCSSQGRAPGWCAAASPRKCRTIQ